MSVLDTNPSIVCGISAFKYPLAPDYENAFNPCFILNLFCSFSIGFAFFGLLELNHIFFKKTKVGGSIAPKNTGLTHWIRVNLVIFQSLLYLLLVPLINIHHRYSDTKILSFAITFAVLTFIILPIHIYETCHSPIPSNILLLYWPCLIALQLILFFQDYTTIWPVVKLNYSTVIELLILFNACSILYMEASKKWWSPSHKLKLYYLKHFEVELSKPHILEKISFTWLTSMIVSSYKKQSLLEKDLPGTLSEVSTDVFALKLSKNWQKYSNKDPKARIIWALCKSFGSIALYSYLFSFFESMVEYINPQLLRLLIKFFSDKSENPSLPLLQGLSIAFLMFLSSCFEIYVVSKSNLLLLDVSLSIKSSLLSLIYEKSLKLSPEARLKHPSASIINLIAVDVPRLQQVAQYICFLIISPIELVVCTFSLWVLLGKSSLAALFVIMISMPINTFIVKKVKKLNKTQMTFKDKRTKLISEIITSIKSLKLYAWEKPLVNRLLDVRNNEELKNWRKIKTAYQFANLVWSILSLMISVATLATYTILESIPMTPDLVFPAMALLDKLSNPLLELPVLFNSLVEASVGLDRISQFLMAPEISTDFIEYGPTPKDLGEESLNILNTSFLWSKSNDSNSNYALKNIDFKAGKGELITIVGKVGSGKSSLLLALLGQLYPTPGSGENKSSCQINGAIAYAAQLPWISNSSVKDNILFGHRFDEKFYNLTLDACQLLPDLKQLPDGDETQVGEKGISLSGGQKARVALARAVYARSDIYLLDDVLSAVDSHVGKKIIEKVLGGKGLLATKTVILSTNSLSVLNYAHYTYLIESGKIIERGTIEEAYDEIKNPKLYELLSEFGKRDTPNESANVSREDSPEYLDKKSVEGSQMFDTEDNETEGDEEVLSFSVVKSVDNHRRASIATFHYDPFKETIPTLKTGPLKEISSKGKVKWSVYYNYAKACSITGCVMFLVISIMSSVSGIIKTYFLKIWAEENLRNGDNKNALSFSLEYFGLGISVAILMTLRSLVMNSYVGIKGSKNIHEKMVKRIIKAPMNFFERTPVGRIMNRFTNDISKVDETLPRVFSLFFKYLVKSVVNLAIVSASLPPFMIIMLLLSLIYMYYQRFYVSISRELKRMLSVSRSPIFAHLQESLNGVDTIIAYDQINRFEYINHGNIDFNLKSLFMMRYVNRWLAVRLGFIGAITVLSAATLAIFSFTTSRPLSAGMAGFVMSYALQITSTLNALVRVSADVESNVVAVERCLEYWELPLEEDEDSLRLIKPPITWPSSGTIEFKDYSTRYAENLDLVLKNITFSIKLGEKIGVVGRTGAGKSSLTLALFRMIQPVNGNITIDEIDTTTLLLYDLRHNLSIIPQDSQLFEGTIRQNLNPLGYFTDEEVWKALELSHLKYFILDSDRDDLPDKLDSHVSEGGSNFSAGQRQLICLARALLSTSNILVLDEATAAVDAQTDKIIQETIRHEFKHKTVIAIAHRLDTVMQCDRILTLDHGEVKEFDSPQNLLQNQNGIFYSLCKQGGFI